MSKEVAKSLTSILENDLVIKILDKTSDIYPVISEVMDFWDFDLFKRKPGPAYTEDGIFVGTDLDLITFLYSLSERGAVINIPSYTSLRPSTTTEGVNVIPTNRHGKLLGVVSNKTLFTFSVRIMDMNVTTSESVGDYRNFSITDPEGEFYSGWSKLEFIPNVKENSFLKEHKVVSDNEIAFKYFIHPNRWVSLYGKHYFITKLLLERLSDESKFYFKEIKRLYSAGYKDLNKTEAKAEYPESTSESGKSYVFKAFEVEVDVPKNESKYPLIKDSSETLTYLIEKRNNFIYKVSPKLRLFTRATEYAFYKYGNYNFPSWIQNSKWETNYVLPKGRTKWNRLVLFQPAVGEQGVALRCREYSLSEKMSEEFSSMKSGQIAPTL